MPLSWKNKNHITLSCPSVLLGVALAFAPTPPEANPMIMVDNENGGAIVVPRFLSSAPEPINWELKGLAVYDEIENWRIFNAQGFCLAETPSQDDDKNFLYVGYTDRGTWQSIGIGQYGTESFDLKEDTRISVSFDDAASLEDQAMMIYRAKDTLPETIPSLLVIEPVRIPTEPVQVDSLEDALTLSGQITLQRVRADIGGQSFWRAFRAGSSVALTMTEPGEEGRVETARGTFSLKGSSATYRALARCSRSN